MTQNGCTTFSGSRIMNTLNNPIVPRSSIVACLSHRPNKAALFTPIRSSWMPQQSFRSQLHSNVSVSHPLNMSASSTPLHSSHLNILLPQIRQRSKPSTAPRAASKEGSSDYRYPPMTEKPRWYWRLLACITYVMPLHEPWMFAESAYSLSVVLERYEFLTYPFFGVIGSFPRWALLIYFLTAYLGVVRRKEWPHFLRHHVVMGMLLEITIQVTGFVSRWVPRAFRYGQLGMYFWNIVAFGFLFTVVECIRCALTGVYADVPFISDAGYIQIPYG